MKAARQAVKVAVLCALMFTSSCGLPEAQSENPSSKVGAAQVESDGFSYVSVSDSKTVWSRTRSSSQRGMEIYETGLILTNNSDTGSARINIGNPCPCCPMVYPSHSLTTNPEGVKNPCCWPCMPALKILRKGESSPKPLSDTMQEMMSESMNYTVSGRVILDVVSEIVREPGASGPLSTQFDVILSQNGAFISATDTTLWSFTTGGETPPEVTSHWAHFRKEFHVQAGDAIFTVQGSASTMETGDAIKATIVQSSFFADLR